jgi:hypothetical protein
MNFRPPSAQDQAAVDHLARSLARCLIGMEACSGSHHIGRRLAALGHDVRLIPAQYVKPFLKGSSATFQQHRPGPDITASLFDHTVDAYEQHFRLLVLPTNITQGRTTP